NAMAAIAAVEGTIILLLTLRRRRQLVQAFREARSNPFMMFCVIYFLAGTWVLSFHRNMGLITRQRIMILPFLMLMLAVAPNLCVTFCRLWRLMRAHRPHVVHTHTMTAGGLGRVAAFLYNAEARLRRWPRARVVHTFHGHVFHGYFSPWLSRVVVLVERMLAR